MSLNLPHRVSCLKDGLCSNSQVSLMLNSVFRHELLLPSGQTLVLNISIKDASNQVKLKGNNNKEIHQNSSCVPDEQKTNGTLLREHLLNSGHKSKKLSIHRGTSPISDISTSELDIKFCLTSDENLSNRSENISDCSEREISISENPSNNILNILSKKKKNKGVAKLNSGYKCKNFYIQRGTSPISVISNTSDLDIKFRESSDENLSNRSKNLKIKNKRVAKFNKSDNNYCELNKASIKNEEPTWADLVRDGEITMNKIKNARIECSDVNNWKPTRVNGVDEEQNIVGYINGNEENQRLDEITMTKILNKHKIKKSRARVISIIAQTEAEREEALSLLGKDSRFENVSVIKMLPKSDYQRIIICKTRADAMKLDKMFASYREVVSSQPPNCLKIKMVNVLRNEIVISDIIDLLSKQNNFPKNMLFLEKTYEVHGDKSNYTNLIVQCMDIDLFTSIISKGSLKLMDYKVKVYEYFDIIQCYKCYDFGHIAAKCKSTAVCNRCAGGHEPKECTEEKNSVTCINCTKANRNMDIKYRVDHMSSYEGCPSIINRLRDLKKGFLQFC